MNHYEGQDSIGMPRGSTLRIEDGAGVLVHVWEGELWLTEEGSPKDHVLRAGEWFRVTRGGAALAHAFRRSLVSLTPAAPGQAVRRIALARAGSDEGTVLYQRSGMNLGDVFRGLFAGLRTA